MKNSYYVDNAGEVQGPVSSQELETLHRSGQVSAITQVCEEGTENWVPYYQAAGAQESGPQPKKQSDPTKEKKPPNDKTQQKIMSEPTAPAFQGVTKSQGTAIIVLLLIAIGAPFFSLLKPTDKWEYMIESPSDYTFSSTMDRYGEQGWELVFARRASDSSGSMSYECIFKRRKN